MDRRGLLKKMVSKEDIQKEALGMTVGANRPKIDFVSTGNLAVDWCISDKIIGGGLPIGRVVEIFGAPSSGKSLIVNGIMGRIQRAGGIAIFDDVEESSSVDFMRKTGCVVSDDCFIRMANKTVEQHFKTVGKQIEFLRSSGFDKPIVVVLDSLAAISTNHEIEAGLDKVDMSRAKVIKAALRQLGGEFAKQKVLYIILNHVIDNIGNRYASKLNPAVSAPGGGGPKFHASIRIQLVSRKLVEEDGQITGTLTRFDVVKNKLTAPFRRCEVNIMLEKGVEMLTGLFDIYCMKGWVEQASPGWFVWKKDECEDPKKIRREDIETLIGKDIWKQANKSLRKELELNGYTHIEDEPELVKNTDVKEGLDEVVLQEEG